MTALPPLAMTYAVYWRRYGVLKVARAWKMRRIRQLVETGAQVLVLVRSTPASWERGALDALGKRCTDGPWPLAFSHRAGDRLRGLTDRRASP